MGEGLSFLDILLVAMVAGFIFLRLRSVLGRRTGHEQQPPPDPYRLREGGEEAESAEDNVVNLPEREGARPEGQQREAEAALWAEDSPIGAGLTQIKIVDHSFEPGAFVQGARAAYEMIVAAFAEGNREQLQRLLNDEVYDNFEGAIESRESAQQTLETTITAIKSADIVDARLNGKIAEVTVKFISDMISVTRTKAGEAVGGAPQEREVTDIWTFARDTGMRDPNWELVATSSEN
ncbi:MAG: Tim44/TimA family putative adaptor protein [Alphaproteobacteria bacterium]|jgi:predicted lipid-binding transport protein (Tim44 family)|nr:Tim44/TimA family putative adaptor protein [Alphaproteobacteria bacterium]